MFPTHNFASQSSASDKGTKEKMLLPLVRRMVAQLDQLFVEFAGPVAPELVGDVFAYWLSSGKTGPSGLSRYIEGLARLLDNPADQVRFTTRARDIVARL
jgi:hypothetical protein